jgi:hypothetical protein
MQNLIASQTDLEAALDLPGVPFVRIITRTLKTPTTKAWKSRGLGGSGAVSKHRETGTPFGDIYPDGIVITRSIVIKAGRSYERDVVLQRIAESENPESPWHGLSADEIEAIGYESEGLHKGYTASIGKHLGVHRESGQVYFVYSPDQDRDSDAHRQENWSRWQCAATGRELTAEEIADAKANLLDKKSKTPKQGVEFDRSRRTLKIQNLLQVKAGDTFAVDGVGFRMRDPAPAPKG